MLKKFISIKNVGRFFSSGAPGNPELAKHVTVLGANGYGKTTLCAVTVLGAAAFCYLVSSLFGVPDGYSNLRLPVAARK